jgi:hypothetical protein
VPVAVPSKMYSKPGSGSGATYCASAAAGATTTAASATTPDTQFRARDLISPPCFVAEPLRFGGVGTEYAVWTTRNIRLRGIFALSLLLPTIVRRSGWSDLRAVCGG